MIEESERLTLTVASLRRAYDPQDDLVNSFWEYLKPIAKTEEPYQVGVLCQSSGYGKSRLLRELAMNHYIVYLPCNGRKDQWPKPSTWATQIVNLVEAQMVKPPKTSLRVALTQLVEQVQGFMACILARLAAWMKSTSRTKTPRTWFEHQLRTRQQLRLGFEFDTSLAEVLKGINQYEKRYPTEQRRNFLIIAFDEAEALLQGRHDENGWPPAMPYAVVRCALARMRIAPVFASTNSRLSDLLPMSTRDPVLLFRKPVRQPIKIFLPFWTLARCKEDRSQLDTPITVSDAIAVRQMLRVGRIAWDMVKHTNWSDERIVAFAKSLWMLEPDPSAAALIALLTGHRIFPTVVASENLVAKRMATLVDVSVRADVGARRLTQFNCNFTSVVKCLIQSLGEAWVNEGDTGELFVRMALILVQSNAGPHITTSLTTLRTRLGLQEPEEPLTGLVNFNHFARAGDPLSAELLVWAFLRRAALIPAATNQMGFDLVLPVYRGELDDGGLVTTSRVGAVLIQVKNQMRAVPCPEISDTMDRAIQGKDVSKVESWIIQRSLREVDEALPTAVDFMEICANLTDNPQHQSALYTLVKMQGAPKGPTQDVKARAFYDACVAVRVPKAR